MGDVPPPPDAWTTWALVTDAQGADAYTLLTLPLTYYGPSVCYAVARTGGILTMFHFHVDDPR